MFALKSNRPAYICSQCLRHRQKQPYSSQTPSPPRSPPLSGAAKLTNRRLISLHGWEAPKFLQGIITNNIRPESRNGFYAAFLTAPGKVLNDVFVYPTLGSRWHAEVNKDDDQGYLVEVDGEDVQNLVKHIKKHKLRSKFELRLLEDGELDVWSSWREDERWTAHTQASSEDGTITLTDCRAPGMGQRLLLPSMSAGSGQAGNHGSLAEVEEAPLSAYIIRRYLRGVPEGQNEIPREDTLPLNANIDVMGGIDFRKGCYVGQELTIRTHHTGVVRRRILPVALYVPPGEETPDRLEYDPSVVLPVPENYGDIRREGSKKRPTGKFVAAIGNVGLAMCRLEQMSDITVSGEGSSFDSGDKFVVAADGVEVGVKAFVPDWLRGRIREPMIHKRVE